MDLEITVVLLLGFSGVIALPVTLDGDVSDCAYMVCPSMDPNKFNIHLLPHSHDDVGWLKTVDQYYFGSHQEIANAGVQYIISSYVEALKANPERKFIQVETAFFWKWWQNQDDVSKQDFRDLVNNGQIEIINGAWSMNDEAAANYHSTIDQFTWGLRKLDESLGKCGRPRIGWQIDPFGHSREQVSLLKQMGFQGLVIGRLDYRDKNKRLAEKNLDFLWQGSANLDDSTIFTSMFPEFYGTIGEVCWDVSCSSSPINDDPTSPDYNLDSLVLTFANKMDTYTPSFKTKNIMVPMGGDFHYQAAELNFANMDKLIKGFENHEKYNVFYSTPSCYVKAVNDEVTANSIELTLKTDDFFPYASDAHAFWTGYFTSRPTSKRFERTANNILQVAKQLTAISKANGNDLDSTTAPLREAVGIMQHHDAITGTEKQAVANDYARIVAKAIGKAEESIGDIIKDLLKKTPNGVVDLKLESCLLANVSICIPSNGENFVVAVYNPLGRTVSHFVRLPVGDGTYLVTGSDGEEANEVLTSLSSFDYIPDVTPSTHELLFKATEIPPLGTKLYYVEKSSTSRNVEVKVGDDYTYGTATTGFTLDPATKLLKSITIQGQTLEVSQEFLFYQGAPGFNLYPEDRASGAYIFRPVTDTNAQPLSTTVTIEPRQGEIVDEVKQIISDRVTQIIRVYKDDETPFIEFDWLVGDLEIDETTGIGTEVITRFTVSNFANQGVFFTDSNGREQIRRERNKRNDYEYDPTEEPAAGNYYPVTSRIVIKDLEKNLEFAVLNDRAQGGASLSEGSVELMIHRRLLRDDDFGVGEALNEQQFGKGLYVRGQHFVTFGPTPTMGAVERSFAHEKLLAPLVLVADAQGSSLAQLQESFNFEFEGRSSSLPDEVHLLTLEPWIDDSYLVRLEHTMEIEDESGSITVDLTNLFTNFIVSEIKETTLAANQLLEEYEKSEKLFWGEDSERSKKSVGDVDPSQIALKPMEIRTFVVKVEKSPDVDTTTTTIPTTPTIPTTTTIPTTPTIPTTTEGGSILGVPSTLLLILITSILYMR